MTKVTATFVAVPGQDQHRVACYVEEILRRMGAELVCEFEYDPLRKNPLIRIAGIVPNKFLEHMIKKRLERAGYRKVVAETIPSTTRMAA